MLRYLPNSQINYQQWDACVSASPQALVYGLSWYLDVVSPGWAGLVEEEQGQYLTVMPLPEARKIGIPYLRQPFFAQQLGLFSVRGQAAWAGVLDQVLHHYPLISRYSFNTGNQQLTFPAYPHLHVQQQETHHLDLSPSYETLRRQYSRDRELNLSRARKAGLQVVEKVDTATLTVSFDYGQMNAVMSVVKDFKLEVKEQDFALSCRLVVAVRRNLADQVLEKLADISSTTLL